MRILGTILIIVGIVWGIFAFNMKTSIEVGGEVVGSGIYSSYVPRHEVHNLSLAGERQNYLMLSGVLLVSGILLFGFGTVKTAKQAPAIITNSTDKKCPFCAEHIKNEAIVCRFCGKDLPEPEKTVPEPDKVYNLTFDNQNCVCCPLCSTRLRLDSKELQASQFKCTDCKSEIIFAITA